MQLYLIRHGIAVDIGEFGVKRDKDRMLSDKGAKRTRQVAKALAAMQCFPDRIVTSPLVRAVQTAGILAEQLTPGIEPELCEHLKPGSSAEEMVRWLGTGSARSVLAVGHMPDLSRLAALLLCADSSPFLELKKAGACSLTFPQRPKPGAARLEWLLEPRFLRQMAHAKA